MPQAKKPQPQKKISDTCRNLIAEATRHQDKLCEDISKLTPPVRNNFQIDSVIADLCFTLESATLHKKNTRESTAHENIIHKIALDLLPRTAQSNLPAANNLLKSSLEKNGDDNDGAALLLIAGLGLTQNSAYPKETTPESKVETFKALLEGPQALGLRQMVVPHGCALLPSITQESVPQGVKLFTLLCKAANDLPLYPLTGVQEAGATIAETVLRKADQKTTLDFMGQLEKISDRKGLKLFMNTSENIARKKRNTAIIATALFAGGAGLLGGVFAERATTKRAEPAAQAPILAPIMPVIVKKPF